MKTGTAVLLSMAIVIAGLAATAGVGYAVYRNIEGQIEKGAAQARADAGLPRQWHTSAGLRQGRRGCPGEGGARAGR